MHVDGAVRGGALAARAGRLAAALLLASLPAARTLALCAGYPPAAASEQLSCSIPASTCWGYCNLPGFVVANTTCSGAAAVNMTLTASSLQLDQVISSPGCCVAPYANIGVFDGCQSSDQYGLPGSHLPIQLKDLAMFKLAWTFQVPMPLGTDWQQEQYRVYLEMFLSPDADGKATAGNITAVFFHNLYGFNPVTGHAAINGPAGMDYIDNGNPFGQGPFVDFLFPASTFAPDASGVVTVTGADIKAILDYAVQRFPSYYSANLYLSNASLAVEAGAFHGTVHTTYASFALQRSGSDVVYTPPFTASHWATCTADADCDDGNACTTDACDAGTHACTHATVPSCPAAPPGAGTPPGTATAAKSGCSSGGGASLVALGVLLRALARRRRPVER